MRQEVNSLKKHLLDIGLAKDNEYLDKYCSLMLDNKHTKREKAKTQRHHIVPRYFFDYEKKECDNRKENIVNLLYKDHLLAHYYLALCSKEEEFILKNILSLKYVLSNKVVRSNKELLDELNKFICSQDKYQEAYEASMKILSKKYSGRIYITRGRDTKVLFDKNELSNYLSSGWKLGKGEKMMVHRGNTQKEICKDSFDSFSSRGWLPGELNKFNLNPKGPYCKMKKDGGKPIKVHQEYKDEYLSLGWKECGFETTVDPKEVSKWVKAAWKDEKTRERMLSSRAKYFESRGKTVWVNNGIENKIIPYDTLSVCLNEGWKQGKVKHPRIIIHKGTRNREIPDCNLPKYLKDGWEEGPANKDEVSELRAKRYKELFKDTTYVVKDGISKRIKIKELESYLSSGWMKGTSQCGKIKVNDGKKAVLITKDELNSYLSQGYVLGEVPKSQEWLDKIRKGKTGVPTSLRGSKYIHKGIEEIRVHQNELEYYISNGWNMGRAKKK